MAEQGQQATAQQVQQQPSDSEAGAGHALPPLFEVNGLPFPGKISPDGKQAVFFFFFFLNQQFV